MLDEGPGVMEKKLPSRQSPAQPKNNGVISEKKSDYISNKNGQQRKYKQSNNGSRSQELSQNPKPVQKYTQPYSDKRPRPRGFFNDRQSEQVAEGSDDIFVPDETSSRKGNANYLLRFSFTPHGEGGWYDSSRAVGGRFGRGGYRTRRRVQTPRYSPEQFLQASCQFIVREGCEYTEQAINPDSLVNWDLVEQVRTFNAEPVVCPICLQKPAAGKITKCGHVYCWSCILHHLQEKELMCRKPECPICPHRIDKEELRSVLCVETRDFKVGDEIQMKLMCKSKGSVYVCPKQEWKDRRGIPHNMNDGAITQYMKLLSATCDQIQEHVINKEKEDLAKLAGDAEEYETCYIDMAKNFLQMREESLKKKIRALSLTVSEPESSQESVQAQSQTGRDAVCKSMDSDTEITIRYSDAFEDEQDQSSISSFGLESNSSLADEGANQSPPQSEVSESVEDAASVEESPGIPQSSPAFTFPPMTQQFAMFGLLTPEEAADHLELPEASGGLVSQQRNGGRNKDTYYFYQASTGQHIYLHSLNAQCLTREYGSLECSPEVITAKIVAIESIFMTEDVRKRLRYLNHIPLTCEFHVVELKFQSPLISRETLQHFQPEFDKRRKARQRKKKEEKDRARQQDVEHKKSFGIYPEVHIPLDNLAQFPAHLGSSPSLVGSCPEVSTPSRKDSVSDSGPEGVANSPGLAPGPRQRNDSEDSQTGMSFAQMLKTGKALPVGAAWGRANTPAAILHISATAPELRSSPWRGEVAADDDDGGEYLPAPSMASSWFDDIGKAMDAHIVRHEAVEDLSSANGGKKKKKKDKQLLFSTSMVRKG